MTWHYFVQKRFITIHDRKTCRVHVSFVDPKHKQHTGWSRKIDSRIKVHQENNKAASEHEHSYSWPSKKKDVCSETCMPWNAYRIRFEVTNLHRCTYLCLGQKLVPSLFSLCTKIDTKAPIEVQTCLSASPFRIYWYVPCVLISVPLGHNTPHPQHNLLVRLQTVTTKGQNYWILIGWDRGLFSLIRGMFPNKIKD